jgi:UDP-N-acetylmuramoylalanine--D-glutamate ligase
MIELRNKRVLVVGLARTGEAVAFRLAREGAIVTVTDLRPPSAFGAILRKLMDQKIGMELGVHREETFLKQDLIVVSPGVPWDLPQLEAARRRKILIVPEVEAASWFFQGTLVGITGTNGKTTTTALLGKMLAASGYATFVVGNIGIPLISAVDLFSADSIVVAELSSFQLEAIQKFRPHIAALLNITENHLDRHRTFDAYISAKAQIFRNQQADDYAILNADDPTVVGLAPAIASRKVFFSASQDLPEGVLLSRGRILYRVGHLERMLMEEREIKLRGKFNVQNVMAAAAAACVLGADFKSIRSAAREFTGVEHRLEYVQTLRGVDFYNDSKATSVDAAAKALSTFERGVHLILGGKDKGAPYTPLKPLIEQRVKSVYLIGAAAEKIAADLQGVDLQYAGDLEKAVEMAFAQAVAGDTVLLSPACASYDQFRDFEERGRAFKEIVHRLAAEPRAPQKWAPTAASQVSPLEPEAGESEPSSGSGPHAESSSALQRVRSESQVAALNDVKNEPFDHAFQVAPARSFGTTVESSPSEAPSETSAPHDPAYIYEVGGGEISSSGEDYVQPELDESGDSGKALPLRPLEADSEPISPYEVTKSLEGDTGKAEGATEEGVAKEKASSTKL